MGYSEFSFIYDNDKIILIKLKESLSLVKSINSGNLKNRRLVSDILEFLDSSRPSFINIYSWNNLLIDKIKYKSVPGMKQFDIDGNFIYFYFYFIIIIITRIK